jgi:P27 family predicted phage terminase small subunit
VGNMAKPIALRLIEGDRGKHGPVKHDIKPRPVAPDCPEWLEDEAKAEWARIAPKLERLGLLSEVDGAALAGYCQAYARWSQAEQSIAVQGMTAEASSGWKQQAAEVSIALKYLAVVKGFCAEFGLTPSARARMAMPGEKAEDDFGDMLT